MRVYLFLFRQRFIQVQNQDNKWDIEMSTTTEAISQMKEEQTQVKNEPQTDNSEDKNKEMEKDPLIDSFYAEVTIKLLLNRMFVNLIHIFALYLRVITNR